MSRDANKLMDVALGNAPADLVVVNAMLLNVYTGELLKKQSISVVDKWIAYVGEDAQDAIGSETIVVDAAGKTLIPGLIDGHTHLGWMCTIDEYLRYIIPGGTTTIVTETLEPYPVGGIAAVQEFLASLEEPAHKISRHGTCHGLHQPEGRPYAHAGFKTTFVIRQGCWIRRIVLAECFTAAGHSAPTFRRNIGIRQNPGRTFRRCQ